ncbi:hypothetical protein LCGC14_3005880, partial [marine sediment metagenome]
KKGNGELTFGQLQNEQAAWADHNFDNQTSDQYFKGLVEELGELAHAIILSEEEMWFPIPEYEGWYEASNHGRIRRSRPGKGTKDGRVLTIRVRPDGYHSVTLLKGSKESRKHYYVHRLVAAAFIGPCPDKLEVNHRDGIKSHNNPRNLEYVTNRENQLHAIRIGLKKPLQGENHPAAKLDWDAVRDIREQYAEGNVTHKQLAEEYDVDRSLIGLVVNGQIWKPEVSISLPDQTEVPLTKALDAIGRLAHADLKQSQGIRGSDAEHEADAKDAIGDLLIYLAGYTTRRGWNLQDIIEEVWSQVKARDWRRWPNYGHPEKTCLECHGNGHLSPDELGFGPDDYEPEELDCSNCKDKGWVKIEKSNA